MSFAVRGIAVTCVLRRLEVGALPMVLSRRSALAPICILAPETQNAKHKKWDDNDICLSRMYIQLKAQDVNLKRFRLLRQYLKYCV